MKKRTTETHTVWLEPQYGEITDVETYLNILAVLRNQDRWNKIYKDGHELQMNDTLRPGEVVVLSV